MFAQIGSLQQLASLSNLFIAQRAEPKTSGNENRLNLELIPRTRL